MIDFSKYEELAKKLNDSVNKLWNKVTFIQVAEVLNNEVNLRELDKSCTKISDYSMDARRALSKEMDQFTEDEYFDKYEEDHTRVENLFYEVSEKADAVEAIVTSLKDISDKNEESDFLSKFSDNQSIDVTESKSFIRLNRLPR
jgi:hypothetical protein